MVTSIAVGASYVVHVAAAALWTGATLYFVGYIMPAARADGDGMGIFRAIDGLLRVTRWTGIVLPVTGGYLIWQFYTLDALFTTPRGWLVVTMAGLWILMNGVIEVGVLRMHEVMGGVDMANYFSQGFPHVAENDVSAAEVVGAGRPHMYAAAVLAVLLLVNAALLSSGLV